MARRASSKARSAAPASSRTSSVAGRAAAKPRVLLAMNASSCARPSCSSRAIRRLSSAVACCSSSWWAAQLARASSRKYPRAMQRSTHSAGSGAPRLDSASTPCSTPSGQTGTQAPCVMPVSASTARKTGPSSSGSKGAATGCRVATASRSPGCSRSGQLSTMRRPELVALRIDRHHAAFDPEVGRPPDLRAQRRGDACRQLGAERGDRRRLRQQRQLARRRVDRRLLVQEPRRALVGFDEAASQRMDGDGQHGADRADQEEPPRDRTGHVRAGQGDGEEGGENHDEGDGRLPALAVEGDADERHEQQDSESAVDAAGRQHQEGHRRRVDGGADEEGASGSHGAAVHDPGGADDEQDGAQPEGPHVRRARGPRRAELPRQGNRRKGHVGHDALAKDGGLHAQVSAESRPDLSASTWGSVRLLLLLLPRADGAGLSPTGVGETSRTGGAAASRSPVQMAQRPSRAGAAPPTP